MNRSDLDLRLKSWSDHANAHCIWIVSPVGYPHHHAFDDIALALSGAFAKLGGSAPVVRHPQQWNGRTPIILGAHLLLPSALPYIPSGSIIYNFEQIDPRYVWNKDVVSSLVRDNFSIDYSKRNIKTLAALGMTHIAHLPLGFDDTLERITAVRSKDIDVLFYGSVNDRRKRVLSALSRIGLNLRSVFGVYGADRDTLIARSKIILNIHAQDGAIFESPRAIYAMANDAFVVSEGSYTDESAIPYRDGLAILPYDYLAKGCFNLLACPDLCASYVEGARELKAKYRQSDLLRDIFSQ